MTDSARVEAASQAAAITAGGECVDVLFRQAMSRLAAGVVMVTCDVDDRPWGMTATACCSVSVDPPLILVSLGASTVSAGAIRRSQRFGVSLLGSRALDAARFASRPGQPKFIDEFCARRDVGAAERSPIVEHAQAHIDCTVSQVHRAADHLLFIGHVQAVALRPPDRPLVYCAQAYHRLHELVGEPRP
jgi:flavin reductase (DIM6/NTAB) family NADH-FMN oxidoreductase RutF